MTYIAPPDPEQAEIAEKLRAKGKERREHAAYVTANRDDWFATAPADSEANAIADAELFEVAAEKIQWARFYHGHGPAPAKPWKS